MIVHFNGELMPLERARVSPLDRGFLFGEGVYEGLRAMAWPQHSARILGVDRHIERMRLGLQAAGLAFDPAVIDQQSLELVRANGMRDAFVYWQVTGGTPRSGDPPRNRIAPPGLRPTVFAYCHPQPGLETLSGPAEKKAAVLRDVRWELGWFKSISLMGNVHMAKAAAERGAEEAVLIRGGDERGYGGVVSEGLATNVVLVLPTAGGGREIVTPSLESAPMLRGVTRDLLLGWEPSIVQRRVTREELDVALEVMLIGTTSLVTAIVALDSRPVGDGRPGEVTRRLFHRLVRGYLAGEDIARR